LLLHWVISGIVKLRPALNKDQIFRYIKKSKHYSIFPSVSQPESFTPDSPNQPRCSSDQTILTKSLSLSVRPFPTMAANAPFLDIDPSVFDPASIHPATKAFNAKAQSIMVGAPKWYEVGAPKYRQMRAAGETPLPAATHLPSAQSITLPSREAGRDIPCRLLTPQNGKQLRGLFMHIHGGGWVLQDEKSQDPPLQGLADELGLVVVSVGYRLAPEHPFPSGPEDCYDAAEYLVVNAKEKFGAELKFVGGESAGGHLSMLVTLHLLQHEEQRYRDFGFKGLLLHFGSFSFNWLPQVYNWVRDPCLVLDRDLMEHYRDAFLPGWTQETLVDPKVSPLYADLGPLRGKLPAALYTCGTEDPLLDDTLFMSAKWKAAGAETVVKIVPGVPHGFIMFPKDVEGPRAAEGMTEVEAFVNRRIGA
jgi:acetyl esterase/lipase